MANVETSGVGSQLAVIGLAALSLLGAACGGTLPDVQSARVQVKAHTKVTNYRTQAVTDQGIIPALPTFAEDGTLTFVVEPMGRAAAGACNGEVPEDIILELNPRIDLVNCRTANQAIVGWIGDDGKGASWGVAVGESKQDRTVDADPYSVTVIQRPATGPASVQILDASLGTERAKFFIENGVSAVAYDTINKVLYWQHPGTKMIVATPLSTRKDADIADAPKVEGDDVKVTFTKLLVAFDGSLLAGIVDSRDSSDYSALMILDTKTHEWLLRKKTANPSLSPGSVVRNGKHQFGFVYGDSDSDDKWLDHYCIDACD